MAKVAKIQHYASLLVGDAEVYGVATLVAGGYTFRPDESREVRLVSYKDPNLMLFGLADVADMQHDIDMALGGFAAVACGREQEVR
jgi:hypothetical protein